MKKSSIVIIASRKKNKPGYCPGISVKPIDMKLSKALLFLLLFFGTQPAKADESASLGSLYADILIYRPIGFAMTMTGAAVFVATSPMLAVANMAPPHNAFEHASDMMIKTPYKFTFERPLGALRPDENGVYQTR
jgi:hypothetical protein